MRWNRCSRGAQGKRSLWRGHLSCHSRRFFARLSFSRQCQPHVVSQDCSRIRPRKSASSGRQRLPRAHTKIPFILLCISPNNNASPPHPDFHLTETSHITLCETYTRWRRTSNRATYYPRRLGNTQPTHKQTSRTHTPNSSLLTLTTTPRQTFRPLCHLFYHCPAAPLSG